MSCQIFFWVSSNFWLSEWLVFVWRPWCCFFAVFFAGTNNLKSALTLNALPWQTIIYWMKKCKFLFCLICLCIRMGLFVGKILFNFCPWAMLDFCPQAGCRLFAFYPLFLIIQVLNIHHLEFLWFLGLLISFCTFLSRAWYHSMPNCWTFVLVPNWSETNIL